MWTLGKHCRVDLEASSKELDIDKYYLLSKAYLGTLIVHKERWWGWEWALPALSWVPDKSWPTSSFTCNLIHLG